MPHPIYTVYNYKWIWMKQKTLIVAASLMDVVNVAVIVMNINQRLQRFHIYAATDAATAALSVNYCVRQKQRCMCQDKNILKLKEMAKRLSSIHLGLPVDVVHVQVCAVLFLPSDSFSSI